jgi:predicted transcriptional regulator of viral defense system
MKNILQAIETPYIDAQTLINLLADYRKPREAIRRMVKNGELIRLKNGFYLIANKIRQGSNTIIPYEQVANLLYGPSYVSLEWALSFYGMIPERVHTITSMTLGKNKEYHTPVGDFVYYRLSSDSYSIGITQKKAADFVGGFLMATPEKALADLVYISCKGLDKDQLKQELLESKRIDRESFHQLNKNLLMEIVKSYHAKRVNYLLDLIGII